MMANMSRFFVEGPFDVPVRKFGWGRTVDTTALRQFWEDVVGIEVEWSRGCYVFAFRAGKGITPVYVGKATQGFRQECFALDKLNKLNKALLQYRRGSLVVFLVALERKRGIPNRRAICSLEVFLIENALAKNEDLLNVQNARDAQDFEVAGVFRGGKGKPSKAARDFKRTMGL